MTAQAITTSRILLVLLTLLAVPLSAAAQVSTQVRLCLQDYKLLMRSGEKDAALDKLRSCARENPGEYTLQKTLGKKLGELFENSGDAALGAEAVTAYKAAAALDAAKFAGLWATLAGLQESLGRTADSIASWEQAMPDLMISERQSAQDALWRLYTAAGEDEKALELWSEVSYRQKDDLGSVTAAARLHQAAERWDGAKDLWKRALELQPDNAEAQAAYNEILAKTAASGGSADKNALLAAWIPKLGEADDAFLAELMALTREVLNPEAEQAIAQEMLMRDPANPAANLAMGEALLSEGDEAGAERALKKALSGGLSGSDEGRAHAVLGRMVEQRTYARYAAAGSKTGKDVINRALRGYDQALSHYRKAAAAGADVDSEIANVRSAKGALGGASSGITKLEVEAAKEACANLSGEAELAYDRGKPIPRTVGSETGLSRSAGASGDSSNLLASGDPISVMSSRWAGGTCWLKVKAADGRTGWIKKSKTR
jgi:tetratricopeptide (TPR) repeat protein